jgi:hypothetical protein
MLVDAAGRLISSGASSDEKQPTVEIVRSFSFKLNLGNYQSCDFFASQKQACAKDEADQVSTDLYDWCYAQVMASVRDVQEKQARKQAAIERKREANHHEGSLYQR